MPKTIILYYSGTGNSLYIAKMFKDAELHPLKDFRHGYELPEDTEKLGFVFPVHALGLPAALRTFLRETLAKRNNQNLNYVFAIATCALVPLAALYDLDRELEAMGVALTYYNFVKLPLAYVPLKAEAASEKDSRKLLEKAEEKMKTILKEVEEEKLDVIATIPFHRLIRKTSMAFTKPKANPRFRVSDKCSLCGLCLQICPEENIEIKDGKICFQDHCASCFGCYHVCPENAIFYPSAKGQYKPLAALEKK